MAGKLQALEQAAQETGIITTPGSVQKNEDLHLQAWFSSTHGGGVRLMLDSILVGFSNLNDSMNQKYFNRPSHSGLDFKHYKNAFTCQVKQVDKNAVTALIYR